jgi:cellulose synthase/poly-beta-1,6-N-acetylglucosamine synthase-like glycosyltransferase
MDSIIKPRFTLAYRASAHPQENEVNREESGAQRASYASSSRTTRQFAPRGTFTFSETVEDYSTARVPVYKQSKPLYAKIGIYGICLVFWAGVSLAVFLFLHGALYHITSLMTYLDLLLIVAILASTCFAQVTRSLYQEQHAACSFAFHQPPSSSSRLGKALEYSVYLLCCAGSLSIFFASTLLFRSTALPLLLSFSLGSLYMILLKPGMAKWIIWMIISPWYRAKQMKPEHVAALSRHHPLVSVIVPAWNEEVGILSTMKSILASTYAPLELIVINDGSTDTSDAKIRAFLAEQSTDFKGKSILYHYQTNTGKSGALNTGIGLAHGEIIPTTDADCVMAPDCVTYLAQAFADPNVMGCTGDYRVGNIHSLLGRVQAIEYAIGFYTRKADSLLGTVFVMSGTVSAFRRSIFDRIGRFHTGNITEDLEITMRMHKAGLKIVSEPRAIVYTESPVTLAGLYRQRLRWVRGTLDAFGEHSDILFNRKRGQGKVHAWVVLPLIRLNHFAVLLQVACKYAILVFCIVAHQYTTLAFTICLITTIVTISLLSSADYRETALLSPLAWILLEIPNTVYVVAFLVGWWSYLTRKKQSWQRWSRQGISGV